MNNSSQSGTIAPGVALVLAASILVVATASGGPFRTSPDIRLYTGQKWIKKADQRHHPRVHRHYFKRGAA